MARPHGATPAMKARESAGVEYRVHEYEHDRRSTSFGLEAAAALGVPASRVFKTLLASDGTALVVGIVPVDKTLDLKALATHVKVKRLVMADPAVAERSTGMVVGGISPVGQKRLLPTVIDESAMGQERVLVSGGRRGLDVELSPQDLVRLTRAVVGSIAAG